MDSSSTLSSGIISSRSFHGDAHSATWLERFLLNLFSYLIVLVPMAVIVFASRYKLCPNFLQSSALVQLFVNGSYIDTKQRGNAIDDSEGLMQDDHDDGVKKSRRLSSGQAQDGRNIPKFMWCFSGLMISYLIWGILQERIMTTKYQNDASISTAQSADNDARILANNGTGNSVLNTSHITFHDSQFLVFINRIIAFILAMIALVFDRPKRNSSRLLYLNNGKYQIRYHKVHLDGAQLSGQQTTKPSAPLYQFVYCSLSNILSSWCQYEALKYVNFPTQVLSKTFKIVPVMIMSKILLHKKYKPVDYGCALALSLGMFIFLVSAPATTRHHHDTTSNNGHHVAANGINHHQNSSKSSLDSTISASTNFEGSTLLSGLLLLSLYLAFDSFTGNWQKSLFTRYDVTNWQMMAAVNLYSILLTLTSLYQLGNLAPALKMLASSRPLLYDCLLMSVMSSIGQFFVYYTINQFGPVVFTVIMTFRQFLAILLSCALYGHQVTAGSGLGIILVFMVVAFQIWHRSSGSSRSRSPDKSSADMSSSKIKFRPTTAGNSSSGG